MDPSPRSLPWPSLVLVAALPLCACASGDLPTAEPAAAAAFAGGDRTGPLAVSPALPDEPPPAAVTALLGEVSASHLATLVSRLASFGTRHTHSDTRSETRGIGAARRYLLAELEGYAAQADRPGSHGLQVSFDRHLQAADGRRIPQETEIVNVLAVLPGTLPEARGRRYYVLGHYDSRASDVMDAESDAPGANDDGSGTALVLELARVMSRHRFDSTVVFLATAGEEQGLYGAALHARAAREAGLDVRAVLSNDIVGDPTSPLGPSYPHQVRVFSQALPAELDEAELRRLRSLGAESDSPSRQLARFVAEVAAWHGTAVQPLLIWRTDRFLRGGDHTAFNRQGFAAVRFSEVEENYDRQHQDVRVEDGVSYGDLPELVDAEYLAGVARVNAAALAHLANAPSTPADARIVVAGLDPKTTLRWSPSPEPDTAGYEVVWRQTTSPVWQHSHDAGEATEVVLPISKDNHCFGVRAYDRDGYRSPVAFAAAARQ